MIYPTAATAVPAWDFGAWHSGPACNVWLMPRGGFTYLVCSSCKVTCDLETVARRITVASSATPRPDLREEPTE